MIFPQFAVLSDLALLLLRVMLGAVFGTSGWSHLTQPEERAESLGMSPAATLTLGLVELVGATALVLGVLTQLAALLLIGVMLGAMYKKIFVWGTGFWGEETQGWYYDLLYLVANLVVLTTGGGAYVLL